MATAVAAPRPEARAFQAPWWAYSVFFMGAQGLFTVYVFSVLLFDESRYQAGPYLSSFVSPVLPIHVAIGSFILSPGFFILWSPLGFRASCYYYRKAYYRAFGAPPACAMKVPDTLQRIPYTGERKFPWALWNFHRFFLYTALANVAFLALDLFHSLGSQGHAYLGLGTLVLLANVVALSAYCFSCHSFRHWVGGSLDCYSCSAFARTRRGIWNWVTALNERHGLYALVSLFTVWAVDIYVRLLAHGVLADPHITF